MTDEYRFLAIDIGAESGRAELITLRDDKVEMEEIHRFANRPVKLGTTLYWDFPFLFAELLESLGECSRRGVAPTSMSVDTWGVDFGLLGCDGMLLGNPVHYRDGRTDNIHEYSNRFMSADEIFRLTGYEPWAISSLFQLLAMQRDGSPLLDKAETFLNMPDLFHYFLTGCKRSEMSIANTSNIMGADCNWSESIIEAFSLRRSMFPELLAPATELGRLCPAVGEQVGLGAIPVIATCGHDTSAALAAVPAQADNWAFLSCGTWSILGSLVERPVATPQCLELGFTNEYTIGGWYLARNILGLWLIQELRRKWDTPADCWDYPRITQEAAAAGAGPLIDAADESLMAPSDMEEALLAMVRGSGQPGPDSRGQLLRGVLESLALEYAQRLEAVGGLTGRRPDALYMVGGGTKNTLLCQLTANACQVPVYAGVDQCTALGNALGQALALGILKTPQEIRDVMRRSFSLDTYEPQDPGLWSDKRATYDSLRQTA